MNPSSEPVIVFTSDHHIGGDGKLDTFDNTSEFIAFLDQLETEHSSVELVLLGDFLELLQITPTKTKNKIEILLEKQEYRNMFQRLKKFSEKHHIFYILGNHDQELYWNKDLQNTLANYGLKISGKENLSYVHRFILGKKQFVIYAEHGNQFDPQNKFIDWSSRTETPLGHHMIVDVVNNIGKLKKGSGREWLHEMSNVRPLELMPTWFISNYFYEELNRILKILAVPILLGFIITRLIPIYFLLKLFNLKFFRLAILPKPFLIGILSIIGIDITIILLFVVFYIIKKDIFMTLHRYGITNYDEIMRKRQHHYTTIAKRIFDGEQITIDPLLDIDFFVHGHTHETDLKKISASGKRKDKGYANIGTWHKGLHRLKTMYGFPPVFIPSYELTYLKVFRKGGRIVAQQWEQGKEYKLSLTPLQRLACLGRFIKKHTKKETRFVREMVFDF